MALGRFQEALLFDEKALAEIQRCADAGDGISQEEIPIYYVNRGRLYLRLGRVDEAEQILQEALPRIPEDRRKYRMFAQEALEEIKQWRQHAIAPEHQLDWRWIGRFRELIVHMMAFGGSPGLALLPPKSNKSGIACLRFRSMKPPKSN